MPRVAHQSAHAPAFSPSICTIAYVAAHGQEPEGEGRWVFRFGPGAEGVFSGTYEQAAALALAEAKARRVWEVVLAI